GRRRIMVRSAMSVTAPAMTKTAIPTPNGASTGPPCSMAKAAATATAASTAAASRRCAAPTISPRFQPRSGPNDIASISGMNSGPKVALKERGAEGGIEERRTDGILVAGQSFERQRIERADENGRTGRRQEQIVENQR